MLSPYFLLIDPLLRGDLAEFLALSLLPWVFYVFDRPRRFSIAQPLILAAFVLSHNLLALIGAALLAMYLLWRGLLIDGPKRWAVDLLSIGLAAALTAIFWLPFIAERNAIRLDVAGPGHFDYHNHFVPLSMLLSPSPVLDMGATTPKTIYNLGLVQWLLLIPAAIVAGLRRKSAGGKIALVLCRRYAVPGLSDHAAVCVLVGPHPVRCSGAIPVALPGPGGLHAGHEPGYSLS